MTPPKIRILVVDDSVVIRQVVSEVLAADPEIEVVGTAANGKIALAKLTQLNPDLVILDVEMPELDGLATLSAIRKSHPKLPVIMFSALTERGAAATLDALSRGASDYFTKPSGPGGIDESRRVLREQLVPAVKALARAHTPKPASSRPPSHTPKSSPPPSTVAPIAAPTKPDHSRTEPKHASQHPIDLKHPIDGKRLTDGKQRVDAIIIATSTGGPSALAELFGGLPADLPVPILIVQHMPPMFTRLLAERLTALTKIIVSEAAHKTPLVAGQALIAPGDHHMELAREGNRLVATLNQNPPENSCRPAADPLLRSAAPLLGPNLLAVVLTGMGQDALRGCQLAAQHGATILAQDEATSVVWGMPGAIVRAGLAHRVLPLSMIAAEIVRRVRGDRPG
jgi:two-component system chemotaxis response regulator CheB